MIPQTSKEKHHKIILSCLKGKELTALEISDLSGLTQHQVSRRMSELREESRVQEVGRREVKRNGFFRHFTVYSI